MFRVLLVWTLNYKAWFCHYLILSPWESDFLGVFVVVVAYFSFWLKGITVALFFVIIFIGEKSKPLC